MGLQYVSFSFSGYKTNVPERESFAHVQLAKNITKKTTKKILFVLDYVPSEDLHSGMLLSGATGDLLKGIMRIRSEFYKETVGLMDVNWLCVSYHTCRTAGKSEDYVESAQKDFRRRLFHIIDEYKPDSVVTFGPDPFKGLNGDLIYNKYNGKFYHFLGRPIPTTTKKGFTFNHFPTLSLNTLIHDLGDGGNMALAGYVARNLNNAFYGDLRYRIPKLEYTSVLVEDIETFDRMLAHIRKAKVVAIDTETENLNRRMNRMLIIQFAVSTKRAFILPIFHKDSPFTPAELTYILQELRVFFEDDNDNDMHVFANASFDLTVIRNNCDVRFFKTDVWDIFGGEFLFDEALKQVRNITGEWYYSLLNLTMQYGCDAYYEAEFGKDQRKTISTVDLGPALVDYCALDVIIPLHIRELQLQRAKDIGYAKYASMAREQLSDMSHLFSTLEYNGAYTDIEYLFYLNTKESPVRAEIAAVRDKLYATKGVRKANAILTSKKGVPAVGLLGKTQMNMFNIAKDAHLQMLFFDVLKLKPVGYGKKVKGVAKPKVDKPFQKLHADVPEVALYTKLQGAKRLFSGYIKAFIQQWGSDVDMRFDRRIRPHFEYLGVVTGRAAARKPSLHQIPARSELGKHIKRLFIAEEGRILIKVDYAVHEVRCWAIFTHDEKLAALFDAGRDLRNKFKIWPDKELGKRVELEGDVHKVNAAYFFGVAIELVDKGLRNAVKGVIFGLIYQQGDKGLAANTGQTIDAIKDLAGRFRKRYPKGVGWFDDVKRYVREHFFVESPLGRRRHTWGLIMPKMARNGNSCLARTERQSVNSPIQGMGSDFLVIGSRCVERLRYKHWKKTGHYPDFYQANSVHDSISFSCAYEDFWLAVGMIEQGLTTDVAKVVDKRHGLKFVVPLEIDFDIGENEKDMEKWSFSIKHLASILKKALTAQKEKGHKLEPKEVYRNILIGQYASMPDWAKKQLWNLGRAPAGKDPRTNDEVMEIDYADAA
jgi:DNA polymerase I-like protein with 3'-5' exonuclease and polymerase domains